MTVTDIGNAHAASQNNVLPKDEVVHNWYRFVLSYPPHLVRRYFDEFGIGRESTILDPFCGTGTTLVEAKRLGIKSVGIEAAPMAHFASVVKTDWSVSPDALVSSAAAIARRTEMRLKRNSRPMQTLSPEAQSLLLRGSIDPVPLHKVLTLVQVIDQLAPPEVRGALLLALAKILPTEVGNLRFGPEVGVSSKHKIDAPVIELWQRGVAQIAFDLALVGNGPGANSRPIHGDARSVLKSIPDASIDAVVTSPPYPNEKDYTRTTRLESVLLGFISTKEDLRNCKEMLLRSNSRNVYKNDDDDRFVAEHQEINDLAKSIEERRLELGKTSGFEKMYPRITKLYFGGMVRQLNEVKRILRPGAHLAYVVGDQASYLRVMIRTGQLLADLAERNGFVVERIDLFRTRMATATRDQLREEVVVLRWPG